MNVVYQMALAYSLEQILNSGQIVTNHNICFSKLNFTLQTGVCNVIFQNGYYFNVLLLVE